MSGIPQTTIPPLNYLTTDNGLSQALNTKVIKDRQGLLWITSYDGINRFDGKKVVQYTNIYQDSNSFSGTISMGILEDKIGNIWTGSNTCMNVFQKNKNRFKHIVTQSVDSRFYLPLFTLDSFVVFRKGNQYYQSNIYNFSVKEIYTDTKQNLKKSKSYVFEFKDYYIVFNVFRDQLGDIFEKSPFTCLLFPKNNIMKPKNFHFPNATLAINSVELLDDQHLILGSYDGLIRYNILANKFEEFAMKGEQILSIVNYDDSKMICTNDNGEVFLFKKSTKFKSKLNFNNLQDVTEIAKYGVREIYVDNQKNVFFSCWGKGLAYFNFDNALFQYSFTKNDLNNKIIADQYISGMTVNDSNEVWVTTKKGGVYSVANSGKIKQYIPYTKKLEEVGFGGDVYIYRGYENSLIITSSIGLFRILSGSSKIEEVRVNWESKIPIVVQDVIKYKSNEYLISTSNGIYTLDSELKNPKRIEGISDQENHIRSFWIQDQYLITCKAFTGFKVFYKQEEGFDLLDSFPINASIKHMHQISRHEIWFASTMGLIKYNLATKTKHIENNRSKWLNTYLYSILSDSFGNIWLSHNNGITRYHIKSQKTEHFNQSHGLQGNEFNTMAFCQKSSNELYFGGTNGLNILRPSEVKNRMNSSHFLLQDFKILDRSVVNRYYISESVNIKLSYNQNTFSLVPVLINYCNSKDYEGFQYKLEGLDDHWIIGTSHQLIRYPNLPAGKYTLRLRTTDTSKQFTLNVTVDEAFWKSYWFMFLLLSGVSAVIYISTRGYYLATIAKQNSEIEKLKAVQEERERIARDMHDNLGSGLTIISYLSNQISDNNLKKVKAKSLELIQNLNEIIWTMDKDKNTLEDLVLFMRKYAFDYFQNTKIEIKFNAAELQEKYEVNNLTRKHIISAYKEILNNALKYSNANSIEISITILKNIEIIIADNGIGIPDLELLNPKGHGIQNINTRIQQIGGSLQIDNSFGTKYRIHIPMKE